MTVDEIFAEISAHMIKGLMVHTQLADYYDFLGLSGYKRCHEYHALKESCEYRGINRYFINHYNRLVPENEIEDPNIIPDNWYKYRKKIYDYSTPLSNIEFYKDLTKTLPICYNNYPNPITAFKSIFDIFYVVYTYKMQTIILYDLVNDKKITEIRNSHSKIISNLKHFLDKIDKRDILISVSSDENKIKLWNINNMECILDITIDNQPGFIFSVYCIYDNNKNYLIISNHILASKVPIRIYDFQGNKINEINDSSKNTFCICTYYDKDSDKNYILTGNEGYSTSFDFRENKLYHEYNDEDNEIHYGLAIHSYDKAKLIDSSLDGNIRVWDFHEGKLLYKIKISDYELIGICLWNKDFVIAGCTDKTIKIIDLNKRELFRSLVSHNNSVKTVIKIIHPLYGDCLLSQGEQIKLWIIKEHINSKK